MTNVELYPRNTARLLESKAKIKRASYCQEFPSQYVDQVSQRPTWFLLTWPFLLPLSICYHFLSCILRLLIRNFLVHHDIAGDVPSNIAITDDVARSGTLVASKPSA